MNGPVTTEFALIEALRAIATSSGARGLADDAAVIEIGGQALVLTLDTLVEGVHFLPDDPPGSVAWKLVAVNASDLSAKGADPLGCLYSHALGDDAWDRVFLEGLAEACTHFRLPLLGGDTVRMPQSAPRSFSLTAIGRANNVDAVPSRSGAAPGDDLWVSGTIGDAGLGLAVLTGTLPFGRKADAAASQWLVSRYRRPTPETRLGPALVPWVSAMMDISDGLLIDAQRIADASAVGILIELEHVPLSPAFRTTAGGDVDAVLDAATAGDDYCLLFAAPAQNAERIRETAAALDCEANIVGAVSAGRGLSLSGEGKPVELPGRLGYRH